jgi:hypothetical protein
MLASALVTPRHSTLVGRARRAALVAIAVVLAAGCGFVSTTRPAPTPADFPGIALELRSRGIQVADVTSGDAGCPDPELAPTAIGLTLAGLDQAEPVRVHLYIFRNRDAFERRRTDVDACARSYVTDPDTFSSIETSPFVLAGQGPWAPAFAAELRAALIEAAGTGG